MEGAVRTTVRLDGQLYRDVKVQAAARGVSVTSILESALRQWLESAAQPASPPPPLPAFGRGGLQPDVPPLHDSAALQDLLDEAAHLPLGADALP
jgi:hypothetical protein